MAKQDTDSRTRILADRLLAEAAGTGLLVLAVSGTALFDAGFAHPAVGAGFLGVALALGLSVVIGATAFGPISGGHFNPAVTLGLAAAGRFAWRDTLPYVVAQAIGGVLGGGVTAVVAAASGRFTALSGSGFASTGWGPLSPGGFGLWSAFVVEAVTTAAFVSVVLTVTRRPTAATPFVIGLTLTVVALVAIPVSNGSFNPARSFGTAVYGGQEAMAQLWLSICAPVLGGMIAGGIARLRSRR